MPDIFSKALGREGCLEMTLRQTTVDEETDLCRRREISYHSSVENDKGDSGGLVSVIRVPCGLYHKSEGIYPQLKRGLPFLGWSSRYGASCCSVACWPCSELMGSSHSSSFFFQIFQKN